MGKLLFVLLIVAIAWMFFKKQQKPRPPSTDESAGNGKSPKTNGSSGANPERMLACGTCGVFMPESDGVTTDGKFGCRDPARCAHRPS